MGYPLAPLMMIREKRYDKALTNQSQCKNLLTMAVQYTLKIEQELTDYKAWKEQEIERRYAEIFEQTLSIKEIDSFFDSLTGLDLKEFELESELKQARQKEEYARQELIKAQTLVKEAHTALFKLQKQKEIWELEQRRLQEYKADLELEDFRSKPMQR